VTRSPRVTIGVPAYNAQAYLASAVEGLLAQTLGDFELIISDNASTDGTRDIAESYCRLDGRVRYERHPVNIGANGNYAGLLRLARGEFFKWSSASDWCAPTYLERCLEMLRKHADTVLVVPRTRLFRNTPENSRDYAWDLEILDETPSARLRRLMSELALNNVMNGLIRTDALRDAREMPPYLGADVVLMAELALRGKFRLLDERLFFRRADESSATALQSRSAVWRHHYPKPSAKSLFQSTRRQLGWIRAALRTRMTIAEQARTLMLVARHIYWDSTALAGDLAGAWRYLKHRGWPD
jgi:glycosyltransferase involved in cell wall biosynthesis